MRTGTRRLLGGLLATGLAVGLVGGLSGCAGSDEGDRVATAGSPASTPTGKAGTGGMSEEERALRFGKCMRENGVPSFPDPKINEKGGISIDAPQDAEPAKVDAAMQKCKPYLPNGGEPIKLDPERLEQLRKLSQCMRDQGIKDFPDPTDQGIQVNGNEHPEFSPDNPTFKAAQEACRKYEPAPAGEAQVDSRDSEGDR